MHGFKYFSTALITLLIFTSQCFAAEVYALLTDHSNNNKVVLAKIDSNGQIIETKRTFSRSALREVVSPAFIVDGIVAFIGMRGNQQEQRFFLVEANSGVIARRSELSESIDLFFGNSDGIPRALKVVPGTGGQPDRVQLVNINPYTGFVWLERIFDFSIDQVIEFDPNLRKIYYQRPSSTPGMTEILSAEIDYGNVTLEAVIPEAAEVSDIQVLPVDQSPLSGMQYISFRPSANYTPANGFKEHWHVSLGGQISFAMHFIAPFRGLVDTNGTDSDRRLWSVSSPGGRQQINVIDPAVGISENRWADSANTDILTIVTEVPL